MTDLKLAAQKALEAMENIDKATFSHVDGRDLFAQMHPRNMLDIKRRIDARETWFEGDWLTDLWREIKVAREAIAALRSALHGPDEALRPSMSMFANAADWNAAMDEWLATPPLLQKEEGDGKDAARLDWLERQAGDGVHVECCHSGSFSGADLQRVCTVFMPKGEYDADTLRAAIDAAMLAGRASIKGEGGDV